jgi:S1-C subfamily serine protease
VKKPALPPRPAGPITVETAPSAPQVVTVLHRLNGLKLFRLMARKNQSLMAIAQLDEAFKIMGDVHTNVIAGLALNDGETVVARLPEVEAELGSLLIPYALDPLSEGGLAPLPVPPKAPSSMAASVQLSTNKRFDEPDVTVIARDGRRFMARYVGLDGVTGLSVLKLVNKSSLPAVEAKIEAIRVGQHLRLFGPEPTTPNAVSGSVSVRVGETEGTITNVLQAPSGGVSQMKLRSAHLTQANIGGIAVNDAGETVGIVDNIDEGEANLLSTGQIRSAARRVLARQSSVPKPWLGVSGEPIATIATGNLLNSGWRESQAMALTQDRCGILLTSVAPNSPAALAHLRSGDVILRVNGEDIRTAEDFSWLLAEAGPGGSVSFAVMRPGQNTAETVNLKLSSAFNPAFSAKVTRATTSPWFKDRLLVAEGIETVALRPAAAARLGANGGLLVIHVEPETDAFNAGLRPGDVIQAINGQEIFTNATSFALTSGRDLTFELVRGKQKLKLTVVSSKK